MKYEGSECWKNIEYTNDLDQLNNARRAIKMASEHDDLEQRVFFLKALEHVNRKITSTKIIRPGGTC